MGQTYSSMLPLGSKAPDFKLRNVMTASLVTLDEYKSDVATVMMFICNHCPYVKHILPKVIEVANNYQAKGMQFIAISSNDSKSYPDDSPEKMRELASRDHYPFPYLYDETQDVARAYQAACTPDFYIFDAALTCVYRGRFDAATPGNHVAVTGEELCAALDALLAGESVNPEQHPSVGCNIKWKS